jgi:AbrB family looped-hinge helix DNA binding protein
MGTIPESMTFGVARIMTERKLVRIQEKGQVTLPAETRRKLGLKKGDLVAVTETPEGVLITPQQVVAMRALDRIGEVLREKGLTLEELIESGRDIRGQILKEQYGLNPEEDAR